MVKFAFYESSFGLIKIGVEDGFVCFVKAVQSTDCKSEPDSLTDEAFSQLEEYFRKKRKAFDLPLKMNGTDFQIKVWQFLCEIPYGETRTYKEIAEKVGNPKASRAVGMVNSKNPLWILVPCHRVVGQDGKLTGYAGGVSMKEKLLQLERPGADE